MPSHKAVQVKSAGAPLELADVETTSPGRGEVRISVKACGICGTDAHFVAGDFPGLSWPLTLGHEIAGTIAEIGPGVEEFAVGDRVAVGWFGGNCNHCAQCRKGQFITCLNGKVPSWHYPGGYAESATVPATALARIPSELSDAEAAPMGCAGVTTYNALRHTKALPGDRVAILGVGGLGHLGIQFARAMGFETIAINRGTAKKEDALELGAHHYIDATDGDVAEALQRSGRRRGGAGHRRSFEGDGSNRRRVTPLRRARHHRGHARAAADQPTATDYAGPQHHWPSVRDCQRDRRHDAVRGADRGAGVDRGAAAGESRRRLRGAGSKAGLTTAQC